MPTRIMSKGTARRLALIQRLTGFHGDGKDVTDPRDLYSILALAESKRRQTCVNVPLLVSESRIQEKINQEIKIRVKGYQPDTRPQTPPAHHRSSLELYDSASGARPTITLVRQSSSLEDLTTLRRKEEKSLKERKSSLSFDNLPRLFENSLNVSFEDSAELVPVDCLDAREIADSSTVVLPKVPKVLEKTLPITTPAKVYANQSDEVDTEGVRGDPRLRGVPNDLRDRAKQILMEETFREKLRARGLGLHRHRSLFPQGRTPEPKTYDLYPEKYWELREDSVQNPRDLGADMINRDAYRMKQKSMLQLKVIECDSKSKSERSPSEKSTTIRVNRKSRPLLEEPKMDEDPLSVSPITKLMLGPITSDAADADPDRDSVCGPPNSRKINRTKPPYFLADEPLPNSINTFPKYTQVLATPRPRYLPPTSVVNLTIDQDTPRQRKPRHIVENLQKQESRGKVTSSGETELKENACSLPLVHVNSSTSIGLSARSEAMDNRNRLLLTGFRKLEVFGETTSDPPKGDQAMVVSEPYRYRPQCHSPVYKLDLRNYPPSGNMIEALMALNQQNTQQETDNPVSLKFKDGQVVISKLPTGREPHSSRAGKSGREVISKS